MVKKYLDKFTKKLKHFLKQRTQNRQITKLAIISCVVLVVAGALFLHFANQTKASWHNDNWAYRKKLVIDPSQVSGSSDLTNFPVLVSLTSDSDLSSHAQADGDDIVFYVEDGTRLNHEIESYSSGTLVAWVKIPTLSTSNPTAIYLYYGNPAATNQQTPENVWDSNYKFVQHLNETSGSHLDSTENDNDTNSITVTTQGSATGKIAGADDFDGVNDVITIAGSTDLNIGTGDMTVSVWAYPDQQEDDGFISHTDSGDATDGWWWTFFSDGRINFSMNDTDHTSGYSVWTSGAWKHWVIVKSGTTITYYQNGSAQTPIDHSVNINDSTTDFKIGVESNAYITQYFDGKIDEVRFSNAARSADWIATEYNNQNSPASFYSTASEETGPGPALYLKFDDAQGTTAYDSMGNNNGTLGASAAAPTWKSKDECHTEGCLDFDGSDDYVTVTDSSALDVTNAGTIQAWVRSNDTSSSLSNFSSWTDMADPDGCNSGDVCEIDTTIVGNKIYYAIFLHDLNVETFYTGYSDLDGSNFSGWTSQTAPNGTQSTDNADSSSVGIDSDGVKLYYASLAYTSFYTAYSDLDGSNFSGWTNQTNPTAPGTTNAGGIDMTIIGDKTYFAVLNHTSTGTNEVYFETAYANLDGTSFSGWTTQSTPWSGPVGNQNMSVSIDSDGRYLYYAALRTSSSNEYYATTYSNLDGSDFQTWTSQTAPNGAGLTDYSNTAISIVGNTIYYTAYLHSDASKAFRTTTSSLDGANFGSWTSQTAPSGATSNKGTTSVGMATDGKKLYFAALSTDSTTEYFEVASADVTSHPIISKSGAYELIQTGGGFVFDWNGSPKSFGSISSSDWNHVAITQDGTTMNYYVNAQLVRSQTTTTDFTSNANDLLVGGDGTRFFNGKIDEIKVYPYARSADEIKQDYISQGSVKGVSAQFGGNDLNARLQEGMIGWWKMDDNVSGDAQNITDISGSGNDGTTVYGANTTGMDCTSSGKFGGGCNFDGTDDYVDIGSSFNEINSTGEVTVSSWVKFDNIDSLDTWWQSSSAQESFSLGITAGGTNKLQAWLKVPSATSVEGSTTLVADTWYHVIFIYDGKQMKLYLNGVLDGTTDVVGTINVPSGPIRLSYGVTAGRFFGGTLDEQRIYNRALDPAEVSALYNYAPGPKIYYNMDQGSGTSTVTDNSGFGKTSDMSGFSSSAWEPGQFGGGLHFDGTDDYLSTATPNLPTKDFTYTFWANFKDIATGTNHGVIDTTGNEFTLLITSGEFDLHTNGSYRTYTPTQVAVNEWNYVTVSRSGSLISIYINGILENTATDGTEFDFSTCQLLIGVDANSGCNASLADYANVILDEFKVYDYARTPAQIIVDMNGGHPLGGSPVGSQVAYYKFDEMSGTTAYDQSINANNLTLSSASWTSSGKNGNAWNGTNAVWLSRADDADLDFSETDDFTISTWFKSDSASNPGATEYLVNKASSSIAGYAIYANTSGQICFGIDDDTSWGPDVASCSTKDYYDATWHHVLAQRDNSGADQTKIYIDGILRDSDSDTTTATLTNSLSFYVGDRDGTDNGDEFAGDIDELKVYRATLSADEILIDYNSGKAVSFGNRSTASDGTTADNSTAREYCVPGDTSACDPPVAEWKLDEGSGTSAYDTSGNGYTGIITNSPWITGKYGNATLFDGSTTYIDTGNSFGASLGTTYTVEAWINTKTVSANKAIASYRSTSAVNPILYQLDQNNGDLRFIVRDDAGSTGFTSIASALTTDTWYHVAGVRNGNTVQVYVNGVGSTPATASIGTISQNKSYIGTIVSGTPTQEAIFSGMIDNVRIYDYARTPAQLAWEYNKGAPIAHYKFDECSGTTAYNSARNGNGDSAGNNGTITIGASGSNTSIGTCSSGTSTEAWNNGSTGKRGASLNFDGTDDYVDLGSMDDSIFNNDFSISAWINVDSASGNMFIFDKRDADDDGFNFLMDAGQIRVSFDFGDRVAGSISADTWTYVTAVRENSVISIYQNGIYEGGGSVGSISTSTNPRIGARAFTTPSATNSFDGQIDDLRIYNYALTPQQIQTSMNSGAVHFE